MLTDGGLIDQIMTTQLLYLQPGKPGDRIGNTFDQPRILCEIKRTDFYDNWDRLLFNTLVCSFRKKGLKRKQAEEAAKKTIIEFRHFGASRIR